MVFGIINLVKKEINSVNFTFYDMSVFCLKVEYEIN